MAYTHDVKTTFPDLVIDQIKIIQKICSSELRDGNTILKNALGEQIIEGDDTRYSFLQSIETLGSMLSPYFGTSSIKAEFKEFCEYCDTELIEILGNPEFKNKCKDIFGIEDMNSIKTDEALQVKVGLFLLNDKVKEGRKIFRSLIKIFKDNSFLGEETYGDGNSASSNPESSSLEAVEEDGVDLLE